MRRRRCGCCGCAALLAVLAAVRLWPHAAAVASACRSRPPCGRRTANCCASRWRPTISTVCGRRSPDVAGAGRRVPAEGGPLVLLAPGRKSGGADARGDFAPMRGGGAAGRLHAHHAAGAAALPPEHAEPRGKLRQIAAALWLEARYSKRELLEAYLNLAPFGGNIQGVGAASRIYFGKAPDRVTLGEALTLAVIPQRPARAPGARCRKPGC